MMHGTEPHPAQRAAIEKYLISTIDHGFNASTFTARVVASTGADLGACVTAAIGALSGPLHGGAPSRALDLLDAIGTPERIDDVVRPMIDAGDKIMGFGHRRLQDRRPALARCCAVLPRTRLRHAVGSAGGRSRRVRRHRSRRGSSRCSRR